MSAFTTLRVSRAAALAALAKLQGKTEPFNHEIEEELDTRLRDTLFNFVIEDEGPDDVQLFGLTHNPTGHSKICQAWRHGRESAGDPVRSSEPCYDPDCAASR